MPTLFLKYTAYLLSTVSFAFLLIYSFILHISANKITAFKSLLLRDA